jgi:NAD(P)-dependent dehydrogenase (short-subunit alcohol dehydrogenase family)
MTRRSVLITGAAGGIGRAAVRHFAKMDWRVVGVDKTDFGPGFPEPSLYFLADLSRPDCFQDILRGLEPLPGGLHALVNNAALQIAKPMLDTSLEEWDALMATNLRSAFLAVKAFHALLKSAAGAAIVNVASVHALQTSTNIAAYAASKGGMLALTRAMAIELAPDKIRVNAVLPGAVDTPMLRAGLGRSGGGAPDVQESLEALARRTVNGRVGQPDEIAGAIYFLADEAQSSFMTGQGLVVDGGATSRLSTE